MMMGFGWGIGMIGMLLNLLFIVGIIYLVIRLVKNDGSVRQNEDAAERILAERFARGEITEEEYRRMKAVLRDKK